MSGGEEDEKEYELKDLIVQTLETTGLLSKIKAQIRSSVFIALDESDKKNAKNDMVQNVALKKVLNAPEGRTAASLVREFLEKCNLDFTLSVFDPELNSTVLLDKREKIANSLKLKDTESNRELPLLIELLKNGSSSSGSGLSKKENFSQSTIDALKSKFDSFDSNKKGLLDEDKFKNLFSNLFSNFSQNILNQFLNEEISKNEFSKGIDFQKYLSVSKKWYLKCQNTFFDAENDAITSSKSKSVSKPSLSSLGDLPPLNNNTDNNKKMFSNLSKDFDRKPKEEEDYEDDFTNGTTPRTPSIGKKDYKDKNAINFDDEIEENNSYIEESSKLDEVTYDRSISTIHDNNDADYIEDVSI